MTVHIGEGSTTKRLVQSPRGAATPIPNGGRSASRFAKLLREPLTQFVLLGFALFAAGLWRQAQIEPHRIVVTPAHAAQLANAYALQFGRAPDPQTLEALIARDVHDEILFRQGEALKLDRDDEIVRRRVLQKMQFLMQDLNAPTEPADAQLRAFYEANASRYTTPPRTTFSHIYFSSDKGGDAAARARAEAVSKTLPPTLVRAPDRGDPFPDLYDFAAAEPEQVYRLFGHSPFADAVASAPLGRWTGPFRSGYGWHLLHVDSREPARRAPLARVRDQVRSDYLENAQEAANQTAFDKLARDYRVVRLDRAAR